MANQFGRTAYDGAKDHMASDERTVLKDKSEVRGVLEAYDAAQRSKLFGEGSGVKVADGAAAEALPDEGTGVAMQVEMAKDAEAAADAPAAPKKGAAKGKAKVKAAARLSVKKGKGKKK